MGKQDIRDRTTIRGTEGWDDEVIEGLLEMRENCAIDGSIGLNELDY